jgi:hypothetical protein
MQTIHTYRRTIILITTPLIYENENGTAIEADSKQSS